MENLNYNAKQGAALIESCLVVMMLCLILFGILQVSYLIAARDVISFTAFAAARSATVGMKDEFVDRVTRTTSIPVAGPMIGHQKFLDHASLEEKDPGSAWDKALKGGPYSEQYWIERHLIPVYFAVKYEEDLDKVFRYCNWVASDSRITSSVLRSGNGAVSVYVHQDVPLVFPFARAFFNGEMGRTIRRKEGKKNKYVYRTVPLYTIEQIYDMEDHSYLYLERP